MINKVICSALYETKSQMALASFLQHIYNLVPKSINSEIIYIFKEEKGGK